jgi:anti-anti-sigma regulatory factor
MFRITRIAEDESSVTLRVEGRLVGRWIDELEHECERCMVDRRRVSLDLSGVTFVDDHGIEALRSMGGHHVEVIQCSLFLSGLLKRA